MAGIGSAITAVAPVLQTGAEALSGFAQARVQQDAAAAQAAAIRAQAQVAQQTAAVNAQIAQQNAALAQQRANLALRDSKSREDRLRRAANLRTAEAAARFFSSGVTLEGTPITIVEETAEEGAFEVGVERESGRRQASDLLLKSASFQHSAQLGLWEADTAASLARARASSIESAGEMRATQGFIRTGTSLLTSLSEL